ncbi:hypothetical protein CEXT_205011, partial [Caerostris extrusa]
TYATRPQTFDCQSNRDAVFSANPPQVHRLMMLTGVNNLVKANLLINNKNVLAIVSMDFHFKHIIGQIKSDDMGCSTCCRARDFPVKPEKLKQSLVLRTLNSVYTSVSYGHPEEDKNGQIGIMEKLVYESFKYHLFFLSTKDNPME